VEWMVKVLGGQALSQIAGDDATDKRIEFVPPPLGADAQYHADHQAQAKRDGKSQEQGSCNNLRKMRQFVDVAGNYQHVAVRQAACNCANGHFFRAVVVNSDSRGTLNRRVDSKSGWQAFEVACDSMPIRAEQV